MIRKSVQRFPLATNAERVCAEIMLKQKVEQICALFRLGEGQQRIAFGLQIKRVLPHSILKPLGLVLGI